MKKFNANRSYSLKQKLWMFLAFFIGHFLILNLTHFIMEKEINLLSDLFQSIFLALLMTLLFSFTKTHFTEQIIEGLQATLTKDEAVQIEVPAGQKANGIVFGGKLFLTNKRLLFIRHGYFQKKSQWSLERENISHIKPAKLYYIADNAIEISDTSGKKYLFNMQSRNEVLEALREEIKLKA